MMIDNKKDINDDNMEKVSGGINVLPADPEEPKNRIYVLPD